MFLGAAGAVTGLVIGAASGVIVAAMELLTIVLRRRARWHQPLAGAVGAGSAVVGTWAGRHVVGLPYPLLAAEPGDLLLD